MRSESSLLSSSYGIADMSDQLINVQTFRKDGNTIRLPGCQPEPSEGTMSRARSAAEGHGQKNQYKGHEHD